jgi:uncharacterized membrane protein YkoI
MKIPSGLSIALALLVCLTFVGTPQGYAANQEPSGRPFMPGGGNGGEEQARVSMREASDRARQAFPGGRVLSIRLEGGQWLVRMDQEGNVFNVFVDANSGQVRRAD